MSVAEEIEKLQALRDRGALSEAEFAQAKARSLGATPATAANSFLHRLRRSTRDHVIGGVCGGLGEHTDLPSWAWRVIFCVAVLYFGIGLLLYLLLWIFIPQTVPPTVPPA
jgi:phage shock protein C